jgi:hypothetical protein
LGGEISISSSCTGSNASTFAVAAVAAKRGNVRVQEDYMAEKVAQPSLAYDCCCCCCCC